MRAWIVSPTIRPDVGSGRGNAHDVFHVCEKGGDEEGGFLCELVGLGLGGDEGAGDVVGAEPVGRDFDPGLLEDGDAGEGGEVKGGGAVGGAGEGEDAVGGEDGVGLSGIEFGEGFGDSAAGVAGSAGDEDGWGHVGESRCLSWEVTLQVAVLEMWKMKEFGSLIWSGCCFTYPP